jgi:hypothetical protein
VILPRTRNLLVPQRTPGYTAKSVMMVDLLSKGRSDFGVRIGRNRAEFDATATPWHDGRRPSARRSAPGNRPGEAAVRVPAVIRHASCAPRLIRNPPGLTSTIWPRPVLLIDDWLGLFFAFLDGM